MTDKQLDKIEIAKDILLTDFAEPVFKTWSKEEIEALGIPEGEFDDATKPSEKNEFRYEVIYDKTTKILSVWQIQSLDHADFNYALNIDEEGNIL